VTTFDVGDTKDEVQLHLAGYEVISCESYDIDLSFFNQPSAWSVALGDDGSAREYAEAFPPRTPAYLIVNGNVVTSGRTDGFELSYEAGGTTISIHGRDHLAEIHDAFVLQEKVFKNATFAELAQGAMTAVGLGDATLVFNNSTNRTKMTGGNLPAVAPPRNVATEKIESVGGGKVFKTPQSKLGERWYEFLNRHLERVGLFFWAAAEVDEKGRPTFVLSEPNTKQKPIARIVHRRDKSGQGEAINVIRGSLKNDTKPRFSEAIIYTRGGGKSFRRGKAKGRFVDHEMEALGYKRPVVLKDADCANQKQAEFMAAKAIADGRRSGSALEYTLSGHTAPRIGGGRITWAPDTVVEVDDDILGVKGPYWVDSVHFSRSVGAGTTTRVVLQDLDTLIYGDPATQ